MADEIKKVKIKELPQTTSINDDDIFVESDSLETYKVTADDIAKYVSTNENLTGKYIAKIAIGATNGVAPLNSDKKINGTYITYGTTSNTAYEGSNGKTLETNLDNHILDENNPHKVTKTQVGLANVENKSSATIRGELTKSNVTTALGYTPLNQTLKGVNNGLAELDSNGKVPSSQLPSYVDDVLEGVATGVVTNSANGTTTATGFILTNETEECVPEAGKIYVDTTTNIQYRWSGSIFVTTGSNITLGETSSTAYRGDRGKTAYDHSQSAHAPSNAEVNQNAFSNVVVGSTTIVADSKTDSLTLAGSNVTLTPDATNDKVTIGITKNNVINALGYTPEESGAVASNIEYGTCNTSADISEKVVTISDDSNWTLSVGAIIFVKFSNTNTASSCTLNVNNTGAKSIWYGNAVYAGNSAAICGYANRTYGYIYDGTYWVWFSSGADANTTYSNASLGQGYGTCTTAETTTAKVVTLSSYALVTGGVVAVKFTYAVPASATMNVNSKGAKAIYYRGSAITAGVIKAGDIATFIYNGSQYHLLTVDRDNNTDTKNTTGSTNDTNKLFLVGAKSQSSAVQTYSRSTVYIDTEGDLCSNDTKVSTIDHTHNEYVNIVYSDTEPTTQRVGDYWCQDYE